MSLERRIGNLYGCTGGNYAGNVYDTRFLAPAILTAQGGGATTTRRYTEQEDATWSQNGWG